MRKLYFGSNQKLTRGVQETADYLRELAALTADLDRERVELFIIPALPAIPAALAAVDQRLVTLGAPDMYWEERGQYTGEVSPLLLKELGVSLVMSGHSERRQVFGETDEEVNKKALCALAHGFTSLVCVGETAFEKDCGAADETLRRQLKIALHGVAAESLPKLWVAYEPVWAIGAGSQPATAEYAEERHGAIRACLRELYGRASEQVPVFYGGSANAGNARALISQPDIDGLFTTRGAWPASGFDALIRDAMDAARDKA